MISILPPTSSSPICTNGPTLPRNPIPTPLRTSHRRSPQPPSSRITARYKADTNSMCASSLEANGAVVDCNQSSSQNLLYLEESIEKAIYRCRFMTMLAVIGSLMGSILCFLKGCWYMINCFAEYSKGGGKVILMMLEATDVYLIGTVMLVFGMGLYELFISNLDNAKTTSYGSNLLGLFRLTQRPQWLEIQSVNELKTKLGHVIVMVLLIGLFEKSKKVTITSSTDLLCFAASILLSSSCLYLLSMLHAKNGKH